MLVADPCTTILGILCLFLPFKRLLFQRSVVNAGDIVLERAPTRFWYYRVVKDDIPRTYLRAHLGRSAAVESPDKHVQSS